ncbi:MAG TPA: hypothetical protein IAB26_01950 [Candidatus Limivivens merdigallinarum]|uniref:Uncharacterized protein n=1 Tax=Candidatus Limivivens merdigallinarum TaxID=2840859 RepID=A0A9D0ZT76_9FIRM|nr:hypothetical protein [Candidatus Limivivens merdigallinarum]
MEKKLGRPAKKEYAPEALIQELLIEPLKENLRGLADTDEESDEYMDIVFSLCTAYERQGYMEGIKVGARLMMELMED